MHPQTLHAMCIYICTHSGCRCIAGGFGPSTPPAADRIMIIWKQMLVCHFVAFLFASCTSSSPVLLSDSSANSDAHRSWCARIMSMSGCPKRHFFLLFPSLWGIYHRCMPVLPGREVCLGLYRGIIGRCNIQTMGITNTRPGRLHSLKHHRNRWCVCFAAAVKQTT